MAIMCNAVQSPDKPFGMGWLPIPGRTAFKQLCAGWLPIPGRTAFRVFRRALAPKHAEHYMERAFSGVYSLPEGAGPEARAASHRARWRERLVAFTVFRRVLAPKRARHPTQHSGQTA